jgi:HSP20 family protein
MTSLMLRDPFFSDLFDFRRDFDEFFNRVFGTLNWPWTNERPALTPGTFAFTPAIESYVDREARRFICRVMLPGVDPNDVNLQVQGNTLTISGERKLHREEKDVDYLHRETVYGSFTRTLTLPEGVEADKLTAEYRNGVLEISAPVSSAALPRRIEIKGTAKVKEIAA